MVMQIINEKPEIEIWYAVAVATVASVEAMRTRALTFRGLSTY